MRVGESVFLRKDGRWEARYCKGRNEKGRIRYASAYGRTREEAEQKRAEILKAMDVSLLIPPKARTETISEDEAVSLKMRPKPEVPLDEETVLQLESAMAECNKNIRLSLALSLYMGLSFSEVCALKFSDIDRENRTVAITRQMYDRRKESSVFVPCAERSVPIPSVVLDLFPNETEVNNYILTDKLTAVTTVRKGVNMCNRELEDHGFTDNIHPDRLTATFIRRAMEAGLNLETISAITGMEKTLLHKKYSVYAKPSPRYDRVYRKKIAAERRKHASGRSCADIGSKAIETNEFADSGGGQSGTCGQGNRRSVRNLRRNCLP